MNIENGHVLLPLIIHYKLINICVKKYFCGYPDPQKLIELKINCIKIFKPGARRPEAGVRLVSRNHFCTAKVCVCVCVCVHPRGYK